MEILYNKLVRDKIPEKIEKNNETALIKILNDKEYEQALNDKFYEEIKEVINSKNKEGLIEELADLLELIYAKAKLNKITFEDIELVRMLKKEKRGGFDNKILLIKTVKRDNTKDS